MLLWAFFAVLTALSAIIVVSPFWRSRRSSTAQAQDLSVYKQQLAEIDDERERGLLGETEAESAKIEISRRIIAAAEKADDRLSSSQPAYVPYVIVAAISAMSLGVYLVYGSPNLSDQPLAARTAPAGEPSIEALIAKVEERLRLNPEDSAGWSVIAPVYMRLGRYQDAANAFAKVDALGGLPAERRGDYAEALTLANNGHVPPKARELFEKAAASNTSDARAQFWLGVSDEQDGKLTEAADRYRSILKDDGLPDQARAAIMQRLSALESQRSGASPDNNQAEMINQMVSRLAERLKADGADLEGWLKLIRAYTVLGRRDSALSAMKQAQSQFAGNQDALVQIEKMAKSLGLIS
ncbi:MAG: c-type cytochrome biogenesis protein CcmI [Rhodomicrobium sp.]|nr:c-type cytochrome biogenesis protein CcmI [Rhodomicrobium sp.]